MKFSQILDNLMQKNNYNKANLSKILDCSKSTVTNWLTETATPNMKQIIRMSEIFDCNIDYLLTGKEYNLNAPSRCLHKLLETNNVTTEQLKSEAHITQSTINMLELDQLNGIEPMQLWAVCNYFHLTVNIFEKMLFEQNNTLIGLTPKLSKEETEKVVAYIQGMIANRK